MSDRRVRTPRRAAVRTLRLQLRLRRRSLPVEVWTLAAMTAVGGLSGLLGSIFPISAYAPVVLDRVLAALGVSLAVALLTGGSRVPRAALHVVLVIVTLSTSFLVSQCATNGGVMLTAFVFQWIAVYAAIFFSARAIRLHALLVTVCFGVAVLVAGLPGTLIEWVIVSATVWTAGIVLGALSERLRTQADTDHLTGLLNRSGLERAAPRELAIAGRTGNPLAIGVLDLDDFKEVNDRRGHAAGDLLLAEIAGAWQATLRPGDVLVRYGGDEFVLMLPATSAQDAEALLARLRDAYLADWSAGIATWKRGEAIAATLVRADRRLYDAKAERRAVVATAAEVAPVVAG